MDALEFIKERNRMCKSFRIVCTKCPAFKACENGLYCVLSQESTLDAMAQIAIVEKWSKENPCKTRQSIFLKQYPYAKCIDGIVAICPKIIDANLSCPSHANIDCPDCRREFWNQEVE